jgi:hypothetical protein
MAAWFQGPWGDYMASVLIGAPSELFDPLAVRQLIDGQRRGHDNLAALFAMTMLELWRREYEVALG